MDILAGVRSLMGSKANRVKNPSDEETKEGIVSDLLPELNLDMTDDELLDLKNKWMSRWQEWSGKLETRQKGNEKYWRGEQYTKLELAADDKPTVDNLIFTSLETFLPIATRQNPEPLVESEQGDQGRLFADTVRRMLMFQADRLNLKIKIQKATRFWSLYMIGVAKMGWSEINDDISIAILRPQKLILDPDCTIDDDGTYTGEFIGEYRRDSASNLLARFAGEGTDPKRVELVTKFLNKKVDGKMGTMIQYIEWWTNEYVFWTCDAEVLGSAKNPHWNYPQSQPQIDPMGMPVVDPMTGQPAIQQIPGYNHFKTKQLPYCFLSVFNLGEHPWDETSLIEQNIPLQDLVNKRLLQYNNNIDNMNGGMVASGLAFTKGEAELAARALQQGGIILVPNGDTNAIRREQVPALPGEVYQSLQDYRTQLAQVFGTGASTPDNLANETTVRGKIMAKSQDETRVGGGVAPFIERLSDNIFNWMVQLMCVYYDQPHYATVLGDDRAAMLIQLKASDFQCQLRVSVKEGSMIPHDPLTESNQAVDLATAGLLDPLSMYERMDFPNPLQTTTRLLEWKTNPLALIGQQPPQPGMPQPGQPPVGQPQGAAQAAPPSDPAQAGLGAAQQQSSLSNVPLPSQAPQGQGMPM